MRARFTTLLLALALGAVVAAGCGSDNSGDKGSSGGAYSSSDKSTSSDTTASTSTDTTTDTGAASSGGGSGGKATELKISADPNGALKFDKSKLSAPAGTVTIVMDNPSSLPHAVDVEGNGVEAKGQVVSQGGTSTAKAANVKAGTYAFYCPVAGHRQAGMEGTLTVK
jgi:uncharacterized cupredoxin-like copper-binding protein